MMRKKTQKQLNDQKILKDIELTNSLSPDIQDEGLNPDLTINEAILRETFGDCSDVIFRLVEFNKNDKLLVLYLDGLSDTKILDETVLQPMMSEGLPNSAGKALSVEQIIEQQLVTISQVQRVSKIADVTNAVLKGSVVLLFDGANMALVAGLLGFEKRSIEEPSAESAIRGPRDGFTETLRINTSLVRRRIRSVKLKIESITIGQFSQTEIAIAYIDGIVPTAILEEVHKRLQGIQIDGVLESSYIEEFIEDSTWSPFPQVQNSERPDVICSSLLEGKVAIFVDNTPFVLVVPMTFWSGLQAADDYYDRSIYTTFIRIIRYCLFNIALLFPSLYVGVTTYHPQLIPTTLLISVAAAREGVPFPTVIETFLMEFMFEGLREAGIRLPKPVGSAVSIVGALVIGQAAVQAGIVSAPVVIVVATTGIASFAIPRYNLGTSYRFLRFPMLILAGTLGLYGIVMGVFCILIHLLKLRSFGIPYLSPVAPLILKNLKDVFIRTPRWSMIYRPAYISGANKKRAAEGKRQSPNEGDQTNE